MHGRTRLRWRKSAARSIAAATSPTCCAMLTRVWPQEETSMSTLQIDFAEAKPSEIDFGKPKSSKIVGIDLGTTNSLVAVMELTGPRILSGIVPSVVSVTESGDVIAGAEAREMLITHPECTVYSVKRLMGRGLQDPDVQRELKLFPFHI